jgi:chorismate lyase
MFYIDLPNTFKPWKKLHFLHYLLDPKITSWLIDSDSLTRRIIKFCCHNNSQFSVQVLKEGKALPSVDEAIKLKMKIRQWAYIREVLLLCGDEPVVYAKTIIPLSTLTGKQRQLAFLGNRPLGAFLFSQANLHRDPIEISKLSHKNQQLWARRSAFYLDNKPLLVYEVFLPKLMPEIY